MNERIQNLIEIGMLAHHAASDPEIIGLWEHAIEAYKDARLTIRSPNRRLVSAYDAGRGAATALVRSANLRVRASNHHETTITAAGFLGGEDLATPMEKLNKLRVDRVEVEYGYDTWFSDADIQRILPNVREILGRVRGKIVEQRSALQDKLAPLPSSTDQVPDSE